MIGEATLVVGDLESIKLPPKFIAVAESGEFRIFGFGPPTRFTDKFSYF